MLVAAADLQRGSPVPDQEPSRLGAHHPVPKLVKSRTPIRPDVHSLKLLLVVFASPGKAEQRPSTSS